MTTTTRRCKNSKTATTTSPGTEKCKKLGQRLRKDGGLLRKTEGRGDVPKVPRINQKKPIRFPVRLAIRVPKIKQRQRQRQIYLYRTPPNSQPSHSSTPKPRLTPRIDLKNFGKPTQNARKLTQKNQQEKSLNESQKQLILKFSLTQRKHMRNPKKATTQSTLLRLKLG